MAQRKTTKRKPLKEKDLPKSNRVGFTGLLLLVTLLSCLLLFRPPNLNPHRQLELEFAFSFCAVQVVRYVEENDAKNVNYFYKEAQRIEPKIKNLSKVDGIR